MLNFLITGTNTGVGKTVFTGLYNKYLNNFINVKSHSIKPFCSGGTNDLEFIKASNFFNNNNFDINYWYNELPVSPAAVELITKKDVNFDQVISRINKIIILRYFDVLLIEAVGGFLSPINKFYNVSSIAEKLSSNLIIVAPNQVGVVNHVLMTIETALARFLDISCVVLMDQSNPDPSSVNNSELISMHLPLMNSFKGVFNFPWLGARADNPAFISVNLKKAEGVLGEIFEKCVLPSLGGDTSVK